MFLDSLRFKSKEFASHLRGVSFLGLFIISLGIYLGLGFVAFFFILYLVIEYNRRIGVLF